MIKKKQKETSDRKQYTTYTGACVKETETACCNVYIRIAKIKKNKNKRLIVHPGERAK